MTFVLHFRYCIAPICPSGVPVNRRAYGNGDFRLFGFLLRNGLAVS